MDYGGCAVTREVREEQDMSFAGYNVLSPLSLAVSLSQSHGSPDGTQVTIIFIESLCSPTFVGVTHLSELPIFFVLLCFSGAMVHQQLSHDGDFSGGAKVGMLSIGRILLSGKVAFASARRSNMRCSSAA